MDQNVEKAFKKFVEKKAQAYKDITSQKIIERVYDPNVEQVCNYTKAEKIRKKYGINKELSNNGKNSEYNVEKEKLETIKLIYKQIKKINEYTILEFNDLKKFVDELYDLNKKNIYNLSEEETKILRYRYGIYSQLSKDEIGKIIGKKEGVVENIINKALKKIDNMFIKQSMITMPKSVKLNTSVFCLDIEGKTKSKFLQNGINIIADITSNTKLEITNILDEDKTSIEKLKNELEYIELNFLNSQSNLLSLSKIELESRLRRKISEIDELLFKIKSKELDLKKTWPNAVLLQESEL